MAGRKAGGGCKEKIETPTVSLGSGEEERVQTRSLGGRRVHAIDKSRAAMRERLIHMCSLSLSSPVIMVAVVCGSGGVVCFVSQT